MIFNAYYPPLEFFMYYFMRLYYRLSDSSWTLDRTKTKSTSVKQYIEIRAGPQYLMHFKYSTILNTVFVTFMFGFGIPILFPICFITLLGIYIIEKASFYYSYRLPPMYNEQLSQVVLDTLMYAPLFYLGFGYWMSSSLQFLSNDYLDKPLETAGSVFESQHVMQSVFTEKGWSHQAWPMLVTFIMFVIFVVKSKDILGWFEKRCECIRIGLNEEADEGLENYWTALEQNDREWVTAEEKNARKLGMRIMHQESYWSFKRHQLKGKTDKHI